MLKKIDELGRIVVPKTYREEIGIKDNEYVDIVREGEKIVVTKTSKMLSQEAIKHLINVCEEHSAGNDYDKGYIDALNYVLGKEE